MFVDEKREGEVRVKTPAQQLILEGIEYLKKHGWCQHDLYDDEGRVCLLGAIYMTSTKGARGVKFRLAAVAYNDAANLIGEEIYKIGDMGIGTWNDRPERTVDQVIDLMQRAAA